MTAVTQPKYAPDLLTVGIVHFGVGNFHRAHQAMYLDRLFNAGLAHEWGVCGVGVLPHDVHMRDALLKQDMTYTLVERAPDDTANARKIASIVEYLFAPDDPEAVIEKLADPAVRIVSLTITEGGYNVDELTGDFALATPAIAADLVEDAIPTTVFGLVTEGLRRRRERGVAPFTVMSCDNLEGNGDVARRSFAAFAAAKDPEIGSWILENVAFPNGMVDRITPVTGSHERRYVADHFGADDDWPVVAESFVQWVLEDRFPAGRPPFELAGVQLVDDVAPYEKMKLRLLNASHQALAYFGYLLGYRFAHEAASDPSLQYLIIRYMREEARPTLAPVPGIDLPEYEATLIERFRNPHIRDTLARLGTDGFDRITTFVLPVIRDRVGAGASVDLSAAVVASWAFAVEGADGQGGMTDFPDRQAIRVRNAIRRAKDDPVKIAEDDELFGELARERLFVDAFARAYQLIRRKGPREAVVSV